MGRRHKQRCERIHVLNRAQDRFGITISKNDIDAIVKLIQSGDSEVAVVLWKTSNTKKAWAVFYEGQWLPVVYNKATKQIVTVLPQDVLNEYAQQLKGFTCATHA